MSLTDGGGDAERGGEIDAEEGKRGGGTED